MAFLATQNKLLFHANIHSPREVRCGERKIAMTDRDKNINR